MSIYYHLRVTLEQDQHEEFIKEWQTKFTQYIIKSVYASELSKEKVHHLHGHIEYNAKPTKQQTDAVSYFMKKRQLSGGQKYNHEPLREDPRKNELYVTKDLKVILWYNYTKEQQEEIINATQAINEDKGKDPKVKLIQRLKEKHKSLLGLNMPTLLDEIKKIYVLDWDKMPPPQLKAYVEYICIKEEERYMKSPKTKQVIKYTHPAIEYETKIIIPPLIQSYNEYRETQFGHQITACQEWEE